MTELTLLFLCGIPIGIFGIVVGGNMFLSFPLFQILFPQMAVGAIVGNIKPGSIMRNLASLWPLRHEIVWRKQLPLLFILAIGSMVGAYFITKLEVWVIPLILTFGFIVMERAAWLSKHVTKHRFTAAAFVVGGYGGIFGGGISLLITTLIRLENAADEALMNVRANALYLETLLTITSVSVFLFSGLVAWHIALTWAAGALLGGYLGGIILKHTGKLSGAWQKNILRFSFLFAITVAIIRLF